MAGPTQQPPPPPAVPPKITPEAAVTQAEKPPTSAKITKIFLVNVEMLGHTRHDFEQTEGNNASVGGGYNRGDKVTEKQLRKAFGDEVNIDRLIAIKAIVPTFEVEGLGLIPVERKD